MKRIYFDHNATTAVEPEVVQAMLPYFSGEFGNASSIHGFGQKARAAVETAREQVAGLMGARAQEIVFTSGGTEADNHAIFGVVRAAIADGVKLSGRAGAKELEREHPNRLQSAKSPHVITTTIEHEAVLNACQALEKDGIDVTYVDVDGAGRVDPESIRRALRTETLLITVMHANNELGTVQPLEEIGKIAAEADVYFHTDAVQSVSKIPVDVNLLKLDLLSLSGHKIYAPKGIGALYVRGGTQIRQLMYGGHHQRGFRPGTENVAGIVGLGKAAEIARGLLASDAARVGQLRDELERGLLQRVPDARVNGAGAARTPNTTNITFAGIEGEALVIALDLKGLACSTGAACSSGAVEPSHVLTAIGLSAEEARASLRFSLGRHTRPEDVAFAVEAVSGCVEKLRALSPVYRKN
ncbi:MAG: aminotransferase class V-fold PLP-dependent enzyme [Acidobacteria bacterium]|nr:aminotransferase class V-fold PLP-dependent enzyme [Acidobacteriota bacterium]